MYLLWNTYQDPEEVEILSSTWVIPALILELGISIKRVQVLLTELQWKKNYNTHIYTRVNMYEWG